MANDGNLRVPTSDEAREIGKKGGIASGKARREKADLRRQMQIWLESDVTTDKHGNPMSGAQLMAAIAAREAAKGNAKFWELIRDTAGYKPVDKVMIADVDQNVIDDIERIVSESEDAADYPKDEA